MKPDPPRKAETVGELGSLLLEAKLNGSRPFLERAPLGKLCHQVAESAKLKPFPAALVPAP